MRFLNLLSETQIQLFAMTLLHWAVLYICRIVRLCI